MLFDFAQMVFLIGIVCWNVHIGRSAAMCAAVAFVVGMRTCQLIYGHFVLRRRP